MDATILADGPCHCFILFDRGLTELQPEVQQFTYNAVRILGFLLDDLFRQGFHRHILVSQPCFKLNDAGGILQTGNFLGSLIGFLGEVRINSQGSTDQLFVNAHPSAVDDLIQREQLPFGIRHWVLFQFTNNGALRLHVLLVVLFVRLPLVRRVTGQVTCATAVGLGGLTGNREIADQILAFLHLPLCQVQRDGDVGEL